MIAFNTTIRIKIAKDAFGKKCYDVYMSNIQWKTMFREHDEKSMWKRIQDVIM